MRTNVEEIHNRKRLIEGEANKRTGTQNRNYWWGTQTAQNDDDDRIGRGTEARASSTRSPQHLHATRREGGLSTFRLLSHYHRVFTRFRKSIVHSLDLSTVSAGDEFFDRGNELLLLAVCFMEHGFVRFWFTWKRNDWRHTCESRPAAVKATLTLQASAQKGHEADACVKALTQEIKMNLIGLAQQLRRIMDEFEAQVRATQKRKRDQKYTQRKIRH